MECKVHESRPLRCNGVGTEAPFSTKRGFQCLTLVLMGSEGFNQVMQHEFRETSKGSGKFYEGCRESHKGSKSGAGA